MPAYTTTNNPAWVSGLKFGYAYDGSTRYLAVLVSAPPQSVTLESAINQPGASGHWSNGTFYLMEPTTQYADSGYGYRTHYFPTNPGVDGVRAEPVTITLRKQGTQETLTVTITPQSTVGLPPNQIILDGGGTPTQPPPPTTTTYSFPDGYLDYPTAAEAAGSPRPTALAGWAADRNQRNVSISVDIFVDGTKVATLIANGNRPDVARSVGDNGLHGYFWNIPAQYQSGARAFAVRYGGNAAQLINSPRTIDFGGTPPTTGPPTVSQVPPDQDATTNAPFDYIIPATTFSNAGGGGLTYTVTNLPAGLSFNAGTRRITGTPTASFDGRITVRATNANGQSASTGFQLRVSVLRTVQRMTIANYGPTGVIVVAYSFSAVEYLLEGPGGYSSGWQPQEVFEYQGDDLLYYNTRRVFSRSFANGPYTAYVRVVNNDATRKSQQFTIGSPTGNRAPVAPPVPGQVLVVNTAYTFTVPAFTDDDNDVLSYSASGLPGWLSFNSGTRLLSGTPPAAATFSITITANDGRGGVTPLVIGFTVNSSTVTFNNTCNYTGRTFISESTNPSMLQIAVSDVRDGTFTLANTLSPTSSYGQISYHIDERDWVSTLNGLRFPQGFPLLIAVWDVSADKKRSGRPHGEQRIVVY